MAIQPPSDIVLDVAKAADPMRYEEARMRLHQMAGSSGTADFDDVFGEVVHRPAARRAAFDPATAMVRFNNTATLERGACSSSGVDARKAAAYEAFEAMTLRGVVETMLPKNAESVYGGGLAGDMWKSMMAEQVATQIAHAGGVGIAEKLLADDRDARKDDVPRTVDSLADEIARVSGRLEEKETAFAGTAAASSAEPLATSALLPPGTLDATDDDPQL